MRNDNGTPAPQPPPPRQQQQLPGLSWRKDSGAPAMDFRGRALTPNVVQFAEQGLYRMYFHELDAEGVSCTIIFPLICPNR